MNYPKNLSMRTSENYPKLFVMNTSICRRLGPFRWPFQTLHNAISLTCRLRKEALCTGSTVAAARVRCGFQSTSVMASGTECPWRGRAGWQRSCWTMHTPPWEQLQVFMRCSTWTRRRCTLAPRLTSFGMAIGTSARVLKDAWRTSGMGLSLVL